MFFKTFLNKIFVPKRTLITVTKKDFVIIVPCTEDLVYIPVLAIRCPDVTLKLFSNLKIL